MSEHLYTRLSINLDTSSNRVKRDLTVPGFLPSYSGDAYTAATRIEETRALNRLALRSYPQDDYWNEDRMNEVVHSMWEALSEADPSLQQDQITFEFN